MIFSPNLDSPLYYLTKKQLFNQYRRLANPIYLKSCQFFGATLIDRTKTLESGFEFEIIDKIPVSTSSLSFEEICTNRAKDIVFQNKKALNILWSGGIDSTVALISILKVLDNQFDISRLKVLLSKESIKEYPSFYKDVIQKHLNHTIIDGTIYEKIYSNDTIITGEHGDQLFGSDKLKYTVISKDAFSNYENILDFVISRKLGTNKFTDEIINYLSPFVKKCPFKVSTLYDYLWWINFGLKWQTVSMRILSGIGRNSYNLEKDVFHFFKSDEFQIWSINNHCRKIKTEWNSYKYIAKDLIYNFHKDEDYLLNKEKEPSLKEVIKIRTKPLKMVWNKNLHKKT